MSKITLGQLAEVAKVLDVGNPDDITEIHIGNGLVNVTYLVRDSEGNRITVDENSSSAKYSKAYEIEV